MVRSTPGAGDRELLVELARRGREDIGASKLERWRGEGLLWRAVVHRGNGRGSTSVLHAPVERVADQVEAIAARTWRGRAMEVSAVALVADGYFASEEALRAGHMRNINEVNKTLAWMLTVSLSAWSGARPRDTLGRAEAVGAWLAEQRGTAITRFKRNLARAPDVAGPRKDRELTLRSGITAAVSLILTGDASNGGLYEFMTAVGLREFVDAMVGDTGKRGVGATYSVERTVEEAAERAGPLVRTSATAGRGLSKLSRALEAPGPQLYAASVIVTGLWQVLEQIPALAAVTSSSPRPTGENPPMHTVAVAMLLTCAAADGIDVAPVVSFALEHELIDTELADKMTDAGNILSLAYPPASAH